MGREIKTYAPEGCEIKSVKIVDNVAVITFREKKRKLPKTWAEFCEINPELNQNEAIISSGTCTIYKAVDCRTEDKLKRNKTHDRMWLPDSATAEAVLALCQLIQLRNAYNGDWMPEKGDKYYCIVLTLDSVDTYDTKEMPEILYFKSEELRDEFLRNFRPLIEKLKPLYGIKSDNQ